MVCLCVVLCVCFIGYVVLCMFFFIVDVFLCMLCCVCCVVYVVLCMLCCVVDVVIVYVILLRML